jgi:uncharacterized protein (DUF433 family)
MDEPLISRLDDVLGGTPVFYSTRVPVRNLIDYLMTGESIETFLDDFPTVRREQVLRFLQEAGEVMVAGHENLD